MLVVLLADPFCDCHCWLVYIPLLLCCWIPLVLVVFYLDVAFSSSSTWNTSTSWVGIWSHQQQRQHVLYQDHCQQCVLSFSSIPRLLCCCLHVTIAIVIVGSRSSCSCCGVLRWWRGVTCWPGPSSHLAFAITVLLSVCHDCHCHCHCWIAFRLYLKRRTLLLLWCSGCRRKGLHGDMLTEDVLTLLMLIKDCRG